MKRIILGLIAIMLTTSVHATTEKTELYSEKTHPQVYCLALNIYYETRGSNYADRVAVADVVINRVEDTRYPDTICEVVKQGNKHPDGSMKRNQCQFSWYCDGKSDRPQDTDAWIDAQQIAWFMVWDRKHRGITEGATHYHANYVEPRWAKDLQLVGRIGVHIFYRWE